MINVQKKKKICIPVTGHKTLADIRISEFVRHKYVTVLQMVSDPGTQQPPHFC